MTNIKLNPSDSNRFLKCTGSELLINQYNESNNQTYLGRAVHYLAYQICTKAISRASIKNKYLKYNTVTSSVELVDNKAQNYSSIHQYYKVDKQIIESINKYIEVIADNKQDNDTLLFEQYLKLETNTDEIKGIADCIILNKETLTIIDYKHGKANKVSAIKNTQLLTYALATYQNYKDTHKFKRIKLIIVQPQMNNVSEWKVELETLFEYEKILNKASKEIHSITLDNLQKHLTPHQESCYQCQSKAICPSLSSKVQSYYKDSESNIRDVRELENEELFEQYQSISLIKNYIASIEEEIFNRLANNEQIGNLHLEKRSKTRRVWKNETEVKQALNELNIDDSIALEIKLNTPPKLEKQYQSGKLSEEQWNTIQSYITQSEAKLSIIDPSKEYIYQELVKNNQNLESISSVA